MAVNNYRSSLEADYANFLSALEADGKIAGFVYEPIALELDFGILKYKCTYTPDFAILNNDCSLEYHETKGFMREDAAVKIKIAASMYPQYKFVIVTRPSKKKGWKFKPIPMAWEKKLKPKQKTKLFYDIKRKIEKNMTDRASFFNKKATE